MHQGHDHDHHHHHHGNGAGAGHNHAQPPRGTVQWQTPHKPYEQDSDPGEPDLDLVEAAFVEGFWAASDSTSFLRLARIPFEAIDAGGIKLVMLRVETEMVTDVGTMTPQLGGGAMRYDPLPAKMAAQRRRLRFIYFDGGGLRALKLAEARELSSA